jgi:hypothetical protein
MFEEGRIELVESVRDLRSGCWRNAAQVAFLLSLSR